MEALQRLHNRGSISTGYDIDNSVKLEKANSEGFNFTNSGAGNRKTYTISYWFKKTDFSFKYDVIAGANTGLEIGLNTSHQFYIYDGGYLFVTNRQFKDPSAWYHFVFVLDTTQSTAANRIKLYVNGIEETSLATDSPPNQNTDLKWNNTGLTFYVGYWPSTNYYSNGYIADVYSIDGQALTASDFGEFDDDTGIWKPIKYTGTYGTNGFKLEFKDSSALNTDTSGNSKSISLNNVTAADQATDTPTNNFAINNMIDGGDNTSDNVSYKEGGTVQIRNANTNYNYNFSTLGMTKGKWYAEFQRGSATNIMIGVQLQNFDSTLESRVNTYIGLGADNHGGAFAATGHYYYNNGATSEGTTYSDSEILGVAVDCDNDKIYFSVDGTYVNSANPASGSNGFDFGPLETNEPCFFVMNSRDPNKEHKANFGGFTTISISSAASDADGYGTFEYAPPSGYYALCTKNLEEYG